MIPAMNAGGVVEAERGFRGIAGYRGLPKLVAALRAHDVRIDRGPLNEGEPPQMTVELLLKIKI